jgi:hypothetical protein
MAAVLREDDAEALDANGRQLSVLFPDEPLEEQIFSIRSFVNKADDLAQRSVIQYLQFVLAGRSPAEDNAHQREMRVMLNPLDNSIYGNNIN